MLSNDGATVVLRVSTGTPTAGGDVFQVTVTNATNSTAGAHSFDISTSSDTTPVTTPTYTLVAAQTVSNTSVVPSTTAAGVSGVTYTVGFKASSTGQLQFPGTVTLTGPAGTFTNASFSTVDTTQNRNVGASVLSNDGATVVLRVSTGTPTAGGDVFQVTVTNATNSTAGAHSFDISTSSDTTPVTTPTYTLGADTTPPGATIILGPSGSTTDNTPTFAFSSSESGISFACRLDGGAFEACTSPKTYTGLPVGPHSFELMATDQSGNSTVVSRTWTIEAAQPKTLADLPKAVLGKQANVQPVKGKVLVAVPLTAAQKGLKFVPLEEARQIPVGSFLDTRKGTVRLQSASASKKKAYLGDFGAGLFQVLQSRKKSAKGLTDLVMKGGKSGSSCAAGKKAQAALSKRALRRLRGKAKGRFRTRGRYSAATVRGTKWTVTDRCDGTLTQVARGKVAVRDFRRKKTVLVKTGKSYLAKAPRR